MKVFEANDETMMPVAERAAYANGYDAGQLEVKRLRATLMAIAFIGESSTTANSLPNIAKLARAALGRPAK